MVPMSGRKFWKRGKPLSTALIKVAGYIHHRARTGSSTSTIKVPWGVLLCCNPSTGHRVGPLWVTRECLWPVVANLERFRIYDITHRKAMTLPMAWDCSGSGTPTMTRPMECRLLMGTCAYTHVSWQVPCGKRPTCCCRNCQLRVS